MLALGATSFLADTSSEMVYPLLPALVVMLGGTAASLGLVEGFADATASLLKLVSGRLSDRAARKAPLVVLGYGIAALGKPLLALATSPLHVLGIRMFDRLGKGVRSAPRDALLSGAVPREHAGYAFGVHRAMDHAGAIAGPLCAMLLLSLGVPVRALFYVALVPGLLAVASLALVSEPKALPAPFALAGAREAQAAQVEREAPTRLPPALRRYLAVLFLFSLGNSSDAFLLHRASQLGVKAAWLPALWMLLSASKLTSSWLGGGLADRMPRLRVIQLGWLVYALAYLGLALAWSPWQAVALFLLYGIYHGLTEPAEKAIVKDLAPARIQGRAFGAYHFVTGIAAIPASLLTGWLFERAGAFVALGAGSAIAIASSFVLAAMLRQDQPHARP